MTKFLDIPAEIIRIIVSKQHLDIKSTNSFREVCLTNQYLYKEVFEDLTKDVQKRGILKITQDKIEKVVNFTEDLEYIKKSTLQISIQIPRYSTLAAMMTDLVNIHNERITEIETFYNYNYNYKAVADLLKDLLPKLNNLQKLKMYAYGYRQLSKVILRSVKTNVGLNTLELGGITFDDEFSVEKEDLPNLRILKLVYCNGDSAVSVLSAAATKLTKLEMRFMCFELPADLQFPKLEKLDIDICGEEILSLLTATAPTVKQLKLKSIDIKKVTYQYPYLETLEIYNCGGEISSLLTAAAPTLTKLELRNIDMNTKIEKAMINLKEVIIDGQKIEMSKCPAVLSSTGNLQDLLKYSRKRKLDWD